jgi:hypothetical protein
MDDPYPYYERDGTRISIDHDSPEGKAKMIEIWSREYRRVAQDYVGDIHVSTVFLAIDHGFLDWREEGPGYKPILFETMVFGYSDDEEFQWRYRTEKDAAAGHAIIVEAVQNGTLCQDTIPYIFTAS